MWTWDEACSQVVGRNAKQEIMLSRIAKVFRIVSKSIDSDTLVERTPNLSDVRGRFKQLEKPPSGNN